MLKFLGIVFLGLVAIALFAGPKFDPNAYDREVASAAHERREWRNMQRERDADFRDAMRRVGR